MACVHRGSILVGIEGRGHGQRCQDHRGLRWQRNANSIFLVRDDAGGAGRMNLPTFGIPRKAWRKVDSIAKANVY